MYRSIILFVALFSFSTLRAVDVNSQDNPHFAECHPLKGMSTFTFFPRYGDVSKETNKKIRKLIRDTFSQLGKVIEINPSSTIDTEGFGTKGFLIYEFKEFRMESDPNPTGFRASLNFESRVQIQRTNILCSSYIWSSNLFFPLSLKTQESMLESLNSLLGRFADTYRKVNTEKPTIYIYLP